MAKDILDNIVEIMELCSENTEIVSACKELIKILKGE